MKEYIECRSCDSSYCNGCNIHTLATMLREGKFDSLMDDKHSIKPYADVVERKRGEWVLGHVEPGYYTPGGNRPWICSECGQVETWHLDKPKTKFCGECGADMREVDHA